VTYVKGRILRAAGNGRRAARKSNKEGRGVGFGGRAVRRIYQNGEKGLTLENPKKGDRLRKKKSGGWGKGANPVRSSWTRQATARGAFISDEKRGVRSRRERLAGTHSPRS